MDILRTYLNTLSTDQQAAFASRCKTSIGYLRKAISTGQRLGEQLSLDIERESGGAVPLLSLRADLKETLDASGYTRAAPQEAA
jgi:hypothetical protein